MAKRGRMHTTREMGHSERNYSSNMSAHKSHASPFSANARVGNGEMPGAGELNDPGTAGPGPASSRYRGMRSSSYSTQVGSKDTPRGMKIYTEE